MKKTINIKYVFFSANYDERKYNYLIRFLLYIFKNYIDFFFSNGFIRSFDFIKVIILKHSSIYDVTNNR